MAEERINDIIAQEAFDQLKQLSADLSESNTRMSELIKTCGELRKSVSEAVDYKGMASAMSQVNTAATQYVKTSSDRLNVERQIKAEGEKMVKVLEEEYKQLFTALNALDKVRKSDEELAAAVVEVDLALESQKKKLKDVKDEVRDSGTINDEQKKKIAELTVTIGELNVKRSEMMRQLKEDANTSTAVNTSYRQMNAQLVMLRNAYKSLTEEERNNVDIGGKMREAINNLDERLKAIDKSIGSNQRNVGNYEVILEKALNGEMSMRRVMMDLQRELTNVEIKRRLLGQTIAEQEAKVAQLLDTEGKTSSNYQQEAATLDEMKRKYTEMGNAVNDLTEKTGFLRDTSSDMQTAVKNAAQDAGGVKAMTESIGLLTQGYNALNALMAVSGADSQQLADIYNRMMIIQNGLNSINKIALALQQQSIIRVKARAALDKVRLLYMKAQTGETAKQAAAEVAETTAEAVNTAATKANTVAEQANTAAKSGNAAATVAATAATGGLAAGEGVATATSFTLVGALKAVGLAIKSIPGAGWIIAIATALAAVIPLLVSMRKKHDELNVSVNEGRRFAQVYNDAANSIEKDVMQMDRLISKINNSEKGSREWEKAVKAVADNLGVSSKWLKENIDKTKELAEAWKAVRLAQVIDDKSVESAAKMMTDTVDGMEKLREEVEKNGDLFASDKQLKKYGEDLRNALNLTNDELKKLYRESAAELVEARKTMTTEEGAQLNIWDFFLQKATNLAKEKGLEIIKRSDEVTKSVKDNFDTLADAARDSASQIVQNEIDGFDNYADFIADTAKKNAETAKKLQLKTIAGAKEYYAKQKKAALDAAWENHKANKTSQEQYEKEVLAIKTRYANEEKLATDSMRKQSLKATDSAAEYYKGILRELESYEDKSLTKTYRGRLNKLEKMKAAELAKYKLTEEQKVDVEKLYAIKRAEIVEEEEKRVQQSIAAAYAVEVETKLKMIEDEARRRGIQGMELSDLLIKIENERYAQEEKNREEAFKKETKDLVEGGEEYVAIRKKYDALYEKAVFDHEAKLGNIRASGIDGEFEKIRNAYKNLINELTIQRGGDDLTEVEKLQLAARQSREELEVFESMTTEQFDKIRQLYEDGIITQEDYASKTDSILKGMGLTMAQYYAKLAELRAKDTKDQKAADEAKKKSILASANVIADSFVSIGDSLQQLTGESIGMTYAMQAISMAQILANQGVAISAAIEKAFNDPSAMNVMMAIASATAGVAAILSQIVSAKAAIDQSRQALSSVNAYAEGTSHHTGGDAVVGEGGKPELVTAGSKTFIVEKPTLIKDLPVGSKVTPLEVQRMSEISQQVDLSGVLASMEDLKKRDRVHIDVGKNVYSYIVKGASKARILNKQFSH